MTADSRAGLLRSIGSFNRAGEQVVEVHFAPLWSRLSSRQNGRLIQIQPGRLVILANHAELS